MRGGAFVCHAARDAGTAQRVVAVLEAAGVPCWIAPRDIEPGESWSSAIVDGLEAAPAVVLVFSAATNDSPHVTRELETAVHRRIPIVQSASNRWSPRPTCATSSAPPSG